MERSPMLMDWQNQYCENVYIAKSNLHVQCNCHQNFNDIHHRDWKATLKSIFKHKRPQIAKAIWSKKNKTRGITVPDFKLYYGTITIKTAWYLYKSSCEDQWNRIEDPDINPHSDAHLNFGIQRRKGSLFNTYCWENWISACRKLN
jgi:hypothetical protein